MRSGACRTRDNGSTRVAHGRGIESTGVLARRRHERARIERILWSGTHQMLGPSPISGLCISMVLFDSASIQRRRAASATVRLEKVFTAAGGPPKVLRMDNGPELISQALQRFCENKVGLSYIPPGTPWNNGYIESFNNRLRKECLNRNHWNTLFEARVVIGDFKDEHNHRHRHSALGYRTPAEYAARCSHTHYTMACEIN